jgi:hypothetical protein
MSSTAPRERARPDSLRNVAGLPLAENSSSIHCDRAEIRRNRNSDQFEGYWTFAHSGLILRSHTPTYLPGYVGDLPGANGASRDLPRIVLAGNSGCRFVPRPGDSTPLALPSPFARGQFRRILALPSVHAERGCDAGDQCRGRSCPRRSGKTSVATSIPVVLWYPDAGHQPSVALRCHRCPSIQRCLFKDPLPRPERPVRDVLGVPVEYLPESWHTTGGHRPTG